MPATALEVGARLPSLELPTLSGAPADTRGPLRGSAAMIFVHRASCAECLAYVRRLTAELPPESFWSATAVLVIPAAANVAERELRMQNLASLPFPILLDAQGLLRERCGVEPGAAAVFVADRWGQIYDRVLAGSTHDFPTAHELEEWFTFLAVYCAECNLERAGG